MKRKIVYLAGAVLFLASNLAVATTSHGEDEINKRVLSIISSPSDSLASESLEGLPIHATGALGWDALCTMYKKLAVVFEDCGRVDDGAEALSRAVLLADGRDPLLNHTISDLGLDPISATKGQILKKITSLATASAGPGVEGSRPHRNVASPSGPGSAKGPGVSHGHEVSDISKHLQTLDVH